MNSKEDAKRFVAGMCETEAEFMHALNIGLILESMGCSDELITAGFLHESLRKPGYTKELLQTRFGEVVASIVTNYDCMKEFTEDSTLLLEAHCIESLEQEALKPAPGKLNSQGVFYPASGNLELNAYLALLNTQLSEPTIKANLKIEKEILKRFKKNNTLTKPFMCEIIGTPKIGKTEMLFKLYQSFKSANCNVALMNNIYAPYKNCDVLYRIQKVMDMKPDIILFDQGLATLLIKNYMRKKSGIEKDIESRQIENQYLALMENYVDYLAMVYAPINKQDTFFGKQLSEEEVNQISAYNQALQEMFPKLEEHTKFSEEFDTDEKTFYRTQRTIEMQALSLVRKRVQKEAVSKYYH